MMNQPFTNGDLNAFLDSLPYRACFYNDQLQLVYSNQQSDGSLFPTEDDGLLPQWIWQQLQESPSNSLHLHIPNDSFNTILMQSYQVLYRTNGQCQGIYAYIQDITPLLSAYLEESGQAVVGWSDVTSGPSQSSHIFED